MNNEQLVKKLLMEQIKVLSHIDYNSDFMLKKPYLTCFLNKKIKENRLKALEMSKKISFACYALMRYENNEICLDETLNVLKDCLKTKYHHIYSTSAIWNINEIYKILSNKNNQ